MAHLRATPVLVLVRDRDRVYGDCLPNCPQPCNKWRSPTRVRHRCPTKAVRVPNTPEQQSCVKRTRLMARSRSACKLV